MLKWIKLTMNRTQLSDLLHFWIFLIEPIFLFYAHIRIKCTAKLPIHILTYLAPFWKFGCLARGLASTHVFFIIYYTLLISVIKSVPVIFVVDLFYYCGSIIDFLRNSYFILQIYHAKSFKMRYVKTLYLTFLLRNSQRPLNIFFHRFTS